jgi:membrane protease YdiL (CAAX protease family)
MIQLIGLIIISWLAIWAVTKSNLSVLGLTPTTERLKYFLILFIVSGICSASAFLLRMYVAKEDYTLNQSLTINSVLLDIWHQFRTVMTEELICRGALLYILIKKIGPTKSIIITSILFAFLHWLNAGVWGNIMQMSIVFVFTFAMGLLLAFSYAKTFSLLIPFAIHFGWNLTQNYIFPDTATGNHVFTLATPPPEVTISYLAFFTMLLLPKISVVVVDYLIIRKHRQVQMP